MGTLTLRGRLVVVDLDYPAAPKTSSGSASRRDTHYVLLGTGDAVWGLRFPPGAQPSGLFRTGMRLEVEVLAADLLSKEAAASTAGRRRRGLAGSSAASSTAAADPEKAIGASLDRQAVLRPRNTSSSSSSSSSASHCHRRLSPGKPCRLEQQRHGAATAAAAPADGADARPRQHPQRNHHQQMGLSDDVARPLAGHSGTAGVRVGTAAREDSAAAAALECSTMRRLSATAEQEASNPLRDGHLTVLSWRPLDSPEASAGGLRVSTREAAVQGPDPSSFWYNEDERIVMDDVSTVIYILDMCDHGPATTKEALEAVLFGTEDVTLESYLSYCSSGLARFNRDNVLILGPIKVPCSGSYVFRDEIGFEVPTDWETSSCRPQDYKGWLRYADQWARDNGYDIDGYRHHVAIVSPRKYGWMTQGDGLNSSCDWTGLGFVGPIAHEDDLLYEYTENGPPKAYREGVFGYAWIDGDHWDRIAGWAHELGHNYYLKHASVEGSEYGDDTSVMGFCCALRCFNAPHTWQLGWREPLRSLVSSDLSIGAAQEEVLPADPRMTPVGSAVRVGIQWLDFRKPVTSRGGDAASADYKLLTPHVWVAYRKATKPFDPLERELANGVHVYLILHEGAHAATSTIKLATLQPGQVWRNGTFQLQVRYTGQATEPGSGADAVVVSLCKFEADREVGWPHCLDGADNDCDGLVDYEDPDCREGADNGSGTSDPFWGGGGTKDGIVETPGTGSGRSPPPEAPSPPPPPPPPPATLPEVPGEPPSLPAAPPLDLPPSTPPGTYLAEPIGMPPVYPAPPSPPAPPGGTPGVYSLAEDPAWVWPPDSPLWPGDGEAAVWPPEGPAPPAEADSARKPPKAPHVSHEPGPHDAPKEPDASKEPPGQDEPGAGPNGAGSISPELGSSPQHGGGGVLQLGPDLPSPPARPDTPSRRRLGGLRGAVAEARGPKDDNPSRDGEGDDIGSEGGRAERHWIPYPPPPPVALPFIPLAPTPQPPAPSGAAAHELPDDDSASQMTDGELGRQI